MSAGWFDRELVAANWFPVDIRAWFDSTLVQQSGPATQTLLPARLNNSNTFFAATVSPGAVTLTPALFSNANSFFAATVSATYSLTPARFDNSQTFYSPTIAIVTTLTPARYDNTNNFFAATVTAGAVTLTPNLYSNANTFYAATVTRGAVTLTPALFTNNNAFYAPTVTAGAVTLTPARYDNANAFYAATVSQGGSTQTLLPSLYVNQQVFYAPVVELQADELERGESWMPQIKRRRRWSEERDEREQLRKDILNAIEPVAEKEAKVVNVKGKVAVVTKSQAIPIPVPPQFDAQAVVRMVMSVLEKQGIEAQRVREAEVRRQARIAFEQERQRRLIKRRREEEIMLLMG